MEKKAPTATQSRSQQPPRNTSSIGTSLPAIMKKSKEEGDENGKIAGNSKDDAIAID
jgi:hypothetical protein